MSNPKKIEQHTNANRLPENEIDKNDERPVCGLIMPIADTDGYPRGHWEDVKNILISVADSAGFKTRLVSQSDSVSIIQTTIVQNVYFDDIVICDVSSKNPNVMFELGLRLAFDKAAVIVKDTVTGYSFDTSPVEHLNYPTDLRYYDVEEFKKDLFKKLIATYAKSKDPNHSMYLESFGKIVNKKLNTIEVSDAEYITKSLNELKTEILLLKENKDLSPTYRQGLRSIPSIDSEYTEYLKKSYYDFISTKKIDKETDILKAFIDYLRTEAKVLGMPLPTENRIRHFISNWTTNKQF